MSGKTIYFRGVEIRSRNAKVPYPIYNVGAGLDCPSARLGLCKIGQKHCYACKNERFRPNSLAFRRRQGIAWNSISIEIFVQAFKRACEKTGTKFFRLNESGDFENELSVRKFYAIAGKLPHIRFFTYTARRDLFEQNPYLLSQAPKNVVLTGSGFMLHNEFGPVEKLGASRCKGNCGECSLCKVRGHKTIFNPMH